MHGGVRTITSHAVCSIREERKNAKTQALNLQQIMEIILDGDYQDDSEEVPVNPGQGSRGVVKLGKKSSLKPVKLGVKRSGPALPASRNKRLKMDMSSSTDTEARTELHVYTHKFEIAYTANWMHGQAGVVNSQRYADDERANRLGWLQEEQRFMSALAQQKKYLNPHTFELDNIELMLQSSSGAMQLFKRHHFDDDAEHEYLQYLATIPSSALPKHVEDDRPGNVLEACMSLQRAGRISMGLAATLLYIPGMVWPELPVQLHINIDVSLVIPAICSPVFSLVPSASSSGQLRRRFLSYMFYYDQVFADGRRMKGDLMDLRQFYSILQPAPSIISSRIEDALQPRDLRASLLPFQKRTVKWLLEREQKTIDLQGKVVPIDTESNILPLFWQQVIFPINASSTTEKSTPQSSWYYNRLTGSLSKESPSKHNILGAMLCEEMGLGKTLECIALMLLSPTSDRNPVSTKWDDVTQLYVSQVKTNLVVTPSGLLRQWLEELATHAPGLKVLLYNGYTKIKLPDGLDDLDEDEDGQSTKHQLWCSYIQGFDVVVTSYKALSQELSVAKAPAMRPQRSAVSYSRPKNARSPLVRVEWARVFMDEVQQVGGGKTAEMVSLIPRNVSIAVSGTPAKSKVSDLSHVLRFLGIEQAVGSPKTWDTLLSPEFDDLFIEIFRRYAVRTVKSRVQDELTIPSQKRYAIGIEQDKAERHIYDLKLHEALEELGVDGRDVAEWQLGLDISLLRVWLRNLRQICTHPQVGTSPKALTNNSAIKTIEEVVQSYQMKNWGLLVTEVKNKIQSRIRRAQLVLLVDDDPDRYQCSRDLYLSAQTEIEQLLDEIKDAIAEHEKRGKKIIEEAAVRRAEKTSLDNQDHEETHAKGKEKLHDSDFSEGEDPEPDGLPRTQLGEDHRNIQRNMQGRLREVYTLEHKVLVLLGDVYHVMGISSEENASYAAAESVRKTLLKSYEESVLSAIAKLLPDETQFRKKLKLSPWRKGAIRSPQLYKGVNEIFGILNDQGELVLRWRAHIFTLLCQRLSDEGHEADGEEYARALDTQGDAESYLEAYAALISDRKEVLLSERTTLAVHDEREIKARETAAAGKAMDSSHLDCEMSDAQTTDNEALRRELKRQRKSLREGRSKRALKSIMYQFFEIGNRAVERKEKDKAKEEGKRLRTIISEQGAVTEKIELELASFRKIFNERILYFRQLQELSDSVAQPQFEDIKKDIYLSKAEEERATLKANAKRAEERYFKSLAKERAEGEHVEEECTLCQCSFHRGRMTPCGHIFCEDCIMCWRKHHGNQKYLHCPMCRSQIWVHDLQRITLNNDDYKEEIQNDRVARSSLRSQIKLNTLSQSDLEEIQTFKVHGSYGAKITHLIRHLLFIQNLEPGSKSVIFSAWSDSLAIIQQALKINEIKFIRVNQGGQKDAAHMFKTDPEILVFLLHGERENAGLNLTCAKRVWLIEPTVNHAFEVQAISRVDRLGQTAATEVFCYYIKDTVEENILQMAARRGLSLYTKDHFEDAIDISDFAMGIRKAPIDSPSKKGRKSKKGKAKQKGDFIAQADDLIHVLFPHLDVLEEELLNLHDIEMVNDEQIPDPPSTQDTGNAIPGPSRLC